MIGWGHIRFNGEEIEVYRGYPIGHVSLQGELDDLDRYRKAEEEGRLVVLPCKVNGTIYEIYNDGFMFPSGEVVHKIKETRFTLSTMDKENPLKYKDFGKTIFTTKSEAEQALKEMEGAK